MKEMIVNLNVFVENLPVIGLRLSQSKEYSTEVHSFSIDFVKDEIQISQTHGHEIKLT